jgi:hypothetical protein
MKEGWKRRFERGKRQMWREEEESQRRMKQKVGI